MVLGSGSPIPTEDRFGSSHVLKIADEYMMFDCGPATTHKAAKMGLLPTQIDHLFFTHHHFDHNVDYPCFLLTRWDMSVGKENQLQVHGPRLTESITERLIGENGAFIDDINARVNHPLSQQIHKLRGGDLPRHLPDVLARDVGPGLVYSGKDWEVSASPADHVQPWLDSLAYRVDSAEGSVVFTGDTAPCDSVAQLAKGADVMFSMCTDNQINLEINDRADGNMGTTAAAKLAQEAGVKKLVLVHIGPGLAQTDRMEDGISEVKREYDGEVVFSNELMVVDI
jgi:ribonuclease Z